MKSFEAVKAVALALPGVEAGIKYDGSPILKLDGCFLAGMATHRSAEADTLVIRSDYEDRQRLIEDAPEQYYVTDYYRPHPVVLVRLGQVDANSLRELLAMSWQLTSLKTRKQRRASTVSGRNSQTSNGPAFAAHRMTGSDAQ